MKRRQFLTAMGLASGSLFLPSLLRRSGAAPGDPPQRLIIFNNQHGTYYPGWRMRWPGSSDNAVWTQDIRNAAASEFSAGLAPLHPWRQKLAIVDGLAIVSAEADTIAALRHEIAQAHVLTGAMSQSTAGLVMAGAASIDQRVAEAISRPDRLRSLELGLGEAPPVTYRGAAQIAPVESRMGVVWDRLFGLSTTASPTTNADAQRSVLDGVAARYSALAGRLSASDRLKLDQHRDMVRDLEKRVSGMASAACADPPAKMEIEDDYAGSHAALTQLVATAFACDLVRVVTVNWGDIPADILGYPGVSVHDEYAHGIHNNPEAGVAMTKWSAYHAQQFADMLAALDAIPEGNGTMLDHTLCVWVSELGDGTHGFERWPVVVAGGSKLKLGQYIHYPSDTPIAGWWWDGTKLPSMGRPHSKLLTTIARHFELTDASGSLVDGMPVRHVYGIDDARIDCTGLIDELFA